MHYIALEQISEKSLSSRRKHYNITKIYTKKSLRLKPLII